MPALCQTEPGAWLFAAASAAVLMLAVAGSILAASVAVVPVVPVPADVPAVIPAPVPATVVVNCRPVRENRQSTRGRIRPNDPDLPVIAEPEPG